MASTKPTIAPETNLRLHPYTIHREEGCDPLLALPQRKAFLEVDDVSIRAVELMDESPSLAVAQERLRDETGVDYDLEALAELLDEKGFLAAADDWEDEPIRNTARERHKVLYRLGLERLAPHITNTPFLLALLLPMVWIGLMGPTPLARPSPDHLIISQHPTVNILASIGGLLAMAYLHELAHFYTARRHGLNPTIHLSHRFYILVLQTDVTDAWLLPRRARLQIFLAGMAFNAIMASVFGILTILVYQGHLPGDASTLLMLRYLTYLNILPMMFQFFIPARTDLYHAILTLTHRRNLMGDSMGYVAFLIARGFRGVFQRNRVACACTHRMQPFDPFCFRCGEHNPAVDRNKMPFTFKDHRPLVAYGLFFLFGSILAYGYVLFIASGFMIDNLVLSVDGIRTYYAAEMYFMTAESVLALALSMLQVLVLGTFMLRGLWSMLAPIVQPLAVSLHVFVVSVLTTLIAFVLRFLPASAAQRGREILIQPLAATLRMESKQS